jgi:hypothetical protein
MISLEKVFTSILYEKRSGRVAGSNVQEIEKKGKYDSTVSISHLPPRHIRECWCTLLRKIWLSIPGMDRFGVSSQVKVLIPEKLKVFISSSSSSVTMAPLPSTVNTDSSTTAAAAVAMVDTTDSTQPNNSQSTTALFSFSEESEFLLKVATAAIASTMVDFVFHNRVEYYIDKRVIGEEGLEEMETVTIKVPDVEGKLCNVFVHWTS